MIKISDHLTLYPDGDRLRIVASYGVNWIPVDLTYLQLLDLERAITQQVHSVDSRCYE